MAILSRFHYGFRKSLGEEKKWAYLPLPPPWVFVEPVPIFGRASTGLDGFWCRGCRGLSHGVMLPLRDYIFGKVKKSRWPYLMKGLSTNENSSDLDVGRFVDNPFTRYRGVKTYSHQTKCFTCSEHDSTLPRLRRCGSPPACPPCPHWSTY